jgi:hypothetical protein
VLGTGCHAVTKDPAVKPGPPIMAQGEVELETAEVECAGLVAALDKYGQCPNLEDGDREWTRNAIEAAEESWAAGKKANPDEPSLHAIAMACHRAALSMQAATERCHAGKRPRVD